MTATGSGCSPAPGRRHGMTVTNFNAPDPGAPVASACRTAAAPRPAWDEQWRRQARGDAGGSAA
jgi:hypothetical protein